MLQNSGSQILKFTNSPSLLRSNLLFFINQDVFLKPWLLILSLKVGLKEVYDIIAYQGKNGLGCVFFYSLYLVFSVYMILNWIEFKW